MRLLIACEFTDRTQVLIMESATEADARVLEEARRGNPESVLLIPCRTASGPVRNHLVRAGRIRSVERDTGCMPG